MFLRLSNFIDKYEILSPHQFGFRKKLSCLDAIVTLSESVYKALDYKGFIIGLFVDLEKTYETVNQSIILEKLHA